MSTQPLTGDDLAEAKRLLTQAIADSGYAKASHWAVTYGRRLLAEIESSRLSRPSPVEGWKLVPCEPTDEMWSAGSAAHFAHERPYTQDAIRAGYAAMLAVSPPLVGLEGCIDGVEPSHAESAEDHYPSHELLHEIVCLCDEHDALNGGGPGWQDRWNKAVALARTEVGRDEP